MLFPVGANPSSKKLINSLKASSNFSSSKLPYSSSGSNCHPCCQAKINGKLTLLWSMPAPYSLSPLSASFVATSVKSSHVSGALSEPASPKISERENISLVSEYQGIPTNSSSFSIVSTAPSKKLSSAKVG